MRQQKRPLKYLFFSILSLASIASLVYLYPPDLKFEIGPPAGGFKFQILYAFFLFVFIFLFSTGTYLFKSKKHGVLIGLFVPLYLIMRLNNLTHPFFFILLAGIFLTLELMVSRK